MAGRVHFTRESSAEECSLLLEGPSFQDAVGFDYERVACSWSGAACECEAELTPITENHTGTWGTSNASLILGGTTFSYCATNNGLTLRYELGDEPQWMAYLRNLVPQECMEDKL